jgi:cytochrome P450
MEARPFLDEEPAGRPAATAVSFDSHDPELAADPFPAYRRLREACPVAWSTAHGGFWVATGHAQTAALARDEAVRTARLLPDGTVQGVSIPPIGQTGRMVPLELDPPESLPYRRTLSSFYSASRITARVTEIRDLVAACLDIVAGTGRCDLVESLTLRVPATLTLRDLGLPEDHWRDIEETLHRSLLASPRDLPAARAAAQELCLELIPAIDTAEPSALVQALKATTVDGRPMADEKIVSALFLLLLGIDPTSSVTATALWYLAAHPLLRARLIREPQITGRAVDEFLRWVSPVQGTCRTVEHETRAGTQLLRPPERVMLSWAAANRDSAVFDDPDAVRLDRAAPHLAFGQGVHYCVGARFARAMATEMIRQVLALMPDYALDGEPGWFPDLSSFYGITYLPVVFTAGRLPGDTGPPSPLPACDRFSRGR